MYLKCLLLFLVAGQLAISRSMAQADLFFGPFKSWTNLKARYGARGDGKADDTQAFQTALDNLGKPGQSPVLYLPAGVYRITASLTMTTRKNIAIIGEDPEKTIIRWDGPDSLKMMILNGVSYSEYERITWDGNHKAFIAIAHEWDGKVPFANSGTQHVDEVFRNLGVGLKSGSNMDAEFAIRRCRFYNCTSTGISLQGFNALDWWVWDCYFENCQVGAANNLPGNGGGNFHVYRSIFNHSLRADIMLGNSEFFSFRDNVSYNSACFITASQWSNTSPITLQGNVVINQQNVTAVDLYTKGNVLLLDNLFIIPDSGKHVVVDISDSYKNTLPDFTLIGNAFTANLHAFNIYGRAVSIDNKVKVVPPKNLPPIAPVPFAKKSTYPVVEMSGQQHAGELQNLIDRAVSKKAKTVVHIAYGDYGITKTLHVPAGADVILVGDGYSSSLIWSGNASPDNPLIQIDPAAKAVLQDLHLEGSNKTDCLLIGDNDQPGNSIYGDQLLLYHGISSNLFIDGFAKTDFRLENFQHNYCMAGTSIKMVGRGSDGSSLLKVFGGESSNTGNSYSVALGGRILLYDTWYENASTSRFLTLRGQGEFVLDGGKIANNNNQPGTFIDIDSFSGKVTLTEIIFNDPRKTLLFNDKFKNAYLLAFGNLNWTDSTNHFFNIQPTMDHVGLVNNRQNTGQGSFSLSNVGDESSNFIKFMLATIRQTRVGGLPARSRIVLKRVLAEEGINNVRVQRTEK